MFKRSSKHNLSHRVSLSSKMGLLMPIALFDVVPGDKIKHKISALIRTQPLLAPVMHTVDVDVHCYFCPDRLIWDNSEDFHTGGDDGMDDSVVPYMTAPADTGYLKGSLADYFGLPIGVPGYKHSALPFRAYAKIYNEHYRDTQLQNELAISYADGLDSTTSRALVAPAWKRDYFTMARPQPQLGPEVTIPLSGDLSSIPVTIQGNGTDIRLSSVGTPSVSGVWENTNTASTASNLDPALGTGSTGSPFRWNNPGLEGEADLSGGGDVGLDVRDLREGNALQRMLEHNNIFGGRYIEQLLSRFNVAPQDVRLDRPEFIGGGETKIQFSEVLQTAEGTDPVGEMKGHGISFLSSHKYTRRIPEHGWIMCFMILRPKTQYMQGLHRMWSRETRWDYFNPEFQDIGDMAILNKEVKAGHAQPDGIFGFTPMYEDYRTIPSRVAGDFRDTLKYWHMAREFSGNPALNSSFITANPTSRIFPDTSGDQLYISVNHGITARRLLRKRPAYRLM